MVDEKNPDIDSQFEKVASPEALHVLPCKTKKPVSAYGKIHLFETDTVVIPKQTQNPYNLSEARMDALSEKQIEDEKETFENEQIDRIDGVVRKTIKTFQDQEKKIVKNMSVEMKGDADALANSEVIMAGYMRVDDKDVFHDNRSIREAKRLVKKEGLTADEAIYIGYMDYIEEMESKEDTKKSAETFRRILGVTQGHLDKHREAKLPENVPKGSFVAAETIDIATLLNFMKKETGTPQVSGIVCPAGKMNMMGHVAITAGSLGIPFVLLGREDFDRLSEGDEVVVSGRQRLFYLGPSDELKQQQEQANLHDSEFANKLIEDSKKERVVETLDGTKINVCANAGLSYDAHKIREANPMSIGLGRTEIADSVRQVYALDVKGHYDTHRENMESFAGDGEEYIPYTARGMDISGDKGGRHQESDIDFKRKFEKEQTEYLIEALLRLNHDLEQEGYPDLINIMIPVVSSAQQLQKWQVFTDTKATELGVKSIELGCMAETSAIFDDFGVLKTKFISVGTNDLIADSMHRDRYKEESRDEDYVSNSLFKKLVQAIKYGEDNKVLVNGKERNVSVSICGDMASDPRCTSILRGLGYQNLSVGPEDVPYIKEAQRRVRTQEAEKLMHVISKTEKEADKLKVWFHFNKTRMGINEDKTLDKSWIAPEDKLDINTLVAEALTGKHAIADGPANDQLA